MRNAPPVSAEQIKRLIEKEKNSQIPQDLQIKVYTKTNSTNIKAELFAKENPDTDAVFIAEEQTLGRGRFDRHFFSPKGRGLYMTQLLHPYKASCDGVWLTITMAVAVCRALEKSFGISAKIKWVNDIFLGGKKLAGILAKGSFSPDGALSYFILGVGINVYGKDFPAEIENTATSIECENGALVDRNALAFSIISELYRAKEEDKKSVIEEYRSRSLLIGKNIRVCKLTSAYNAKAIDITDSGSLKILKEDGSTEELISGEVSVREV